ncbi:phosphotransferase enzyme family protein (plasmid) [Fusobacterium vincentii]|uniref:Phosphotransferase enzyme family protein n=1 Tax=Fusobacterium nucleatum TaxID=851 RepID=A0AAX3M7L5_FUSNU|nr:MULTISPECIES: phosphotransferase enzyme family protein [Fusobacterium]MCG6836271.1 phosphotransferase enzyme family protein [Fusobacterium nucleatum]QYR56897.1 phosphotransferase enzyme family protein [Fusobacterium vincentii]WDA43066.1 phosphotransferase enzyme family protein [Fusobacterium nucleatum]BET15157.1 phosphotransferase enzyme family protein [Fusobacterium vincentii]
MGVFTNLFQDEIKFIEEKYKIKILKIKNIDNGILNSNFYIETKNKKYILRIYEANRIVDEEKQELILLDKIAGFIPVSKAIKNIDNEYISIFTNKKFALFEYINGNSITKIDTHIVREIAMYLGKLHSFSKEISFEEYNRKTRIDFNFYYNEIKKSEINFRFKNELLNLANEINDFDFSTLPSGIIHGDIFPDNVLLDEYNNIKVIFDFNESYYAPFIFDIAIVINFWIKINDFDFFTENNLIRDFLNYYSKYRKITKEELKSLDIACKKIALTFIFLRIYKKKIENSYQKAISIQKKSYLDLIKLIKNK